MKKFKNFINETVIKLRGFGTSGPPSGQVDKFMSDLHATTKENPFNSRVRVFNGNVGVHVSPMRNSVHIHDISSYEPKSGAGTEALQHLTSLADKHDVRLVGTAKAYTSEGGRIGTSKRLKKWYTKHGFTADHGDEDDGYDIRYQPKS
jgi:hypothetical protein